MALTFTLKSVSRGACFGIFNENSTMDGRLSRAELLGRRLRPIVVDDELFVAIASEGARTRRGPLRHTRNVIRAVFPGEPPLAAERWFAVDVLENDVRALAALHRC